MNPTPIQALFLDVGGVLLTNGWDRKSRQAGAKSFNLDYADMDERHHLTYDTYEVGKISLDAYLDRVVFFEKRPFTKEQFKAFMFSQSLPYQETIDFFKALKAAHDLKTGIVSNEGREIMEYRIQKFDLGSFVNFFVISAFVHFRKPDEDIFRLALDIAQVPREACVYVDDRPLFVEVARHLGMNAIHHKDLPTTRKALEALGLSLK